MPIVINAPPSRTQFLERDPKTGKLTGNVSQVWIVWFGEFIAALLTIRGIAEAVEIESQFADAASRESLAETLAAGLLLDSSSTRGRDSDNDAASLFDGADSPARANEQTSLADLLALFESGPVPPSDDPYSAAWDGSQRAATQNALYDEFVAVLAFAQSLISDIAYNAGTWNGVTTIGASKNVIRDEFELRMPGVVAHTIPLAKLTPGGTNGSLTVNAYGIVTAYADPT